MRASRRQAVALDGSHERTSTADARRNLLGRTRSENTAFGHCLPGRRGFARGARTDAFIIDVMIAVLPSGVDGTPPATIFRP